MVDYFYWASGAGIVAAVAIGLWFWEFLERRALDARFKGILDPEEEIRNLNSDVKKLRAAYAEKRQYLAQLEKDVAVYEEKMALAELGIYSPHFDFTDSQSYKEAILLIRSEQKTQIGSGNAVVCKINWQVDGSRKKGQAMTNRLIKLTLRAFNNECEASIANVRWNNFNAMEGRIVKAAEQINRLNESQAVKIDQSYVNLKLRELHLTHQQREILKQEREDKAELGRQKRDEQRLVRQAEAAQENEARFQDMLAKAQREVTSATGARHDELRNRVIVLEQQLLLAQQENAKATAMAQLTRSGFVYVISNVGAFGEHIVKIGMTRRIDPDERVRELGDASVPFTFDTHAMIYSDDAPALETALHTHFKDRRVNTANYRKEFFWAQISEVEQAVTQLAPRAPFFRDREAQEYHQTIAMRHQLAAHLKAQSPPKLPMAV